LNVKHIYFSALHYLLRFSICVVLSGSLTPTQNMYHCTSYCNYFLTPGSKGSRGLKTKVKNKNQVAGVALVQIGSNCKGSFEG